jgi:1-deoxy-D-xylulose-5-phosphate synthase
LQVLSEKGGHFASNLGTVELAVALHYVFETPDDKIVWDVGHQAYPHKILTGRREKFPTIRQEGGLSGFTCRSESLYDHFGAGHASTSISAALGIAEGMRHSGSKHLAIAVIGDGSMTGGLAFEALNNAGHIPARNLVVILNDNDMSIDPNVGALNHFVNHAITHPGYNRLRKEFRDLVGSLGERGALLRNFASKLRKSVKNVFTPGMLFECFGFRYFGPVDGHNLEELLETLQFIQKEGSSGGPYLVHAITVKGKGYARAEELPLKYHAVTPFKIADGLNPPSSPKKANYQDIFADALIREAHADPRIIAITAAMPSGTGLNKFQKALPERCYDVGIAEAHAVLFGAGLATEGYRPVVAIYSTFLQRAYDQIIHDVALQNLPVVFALDRGGLVGADGATHQGAFDLTYLRVIPEMVVMAPKDENELQHMVHTALQYEKGPIAFRYPRGEVVGVPLDSEPRRIPIGEAELLSADSERPDFTLIAIGYSVQSALGAAEILREAGHSVCVINARFVKPLDESLLSKWIQAAKVTVTIEENSVIGGFGSAVCELAQRCRLGDSICMLGLPDEFVEHATPKAQREQVGIDPQSIAKAALQRLKSYVRPSSPSRRKDLPTTVFEPPKQLQ